MNETDRSKVSSAEIGRSIAEMVASAVAVKAKLLQNHERGETTKQIYEMSLGIVDEQYRTREVRGACAVLSQREGEVAGRPDLGKTEEFYLTS